MKLETVAKACHKVILGGAPSASGEVHGTCGKPRSHVEVTPVMSIYAKINITTYYRQNHN